MSEARVEVDYVANARSVENANASIARGIQKNAEASHAATQQQVNDLREVERSAEKAGRAQVRARNQDLRAGRGFTGRSGDYIATNFGALGVATPGEATLQHTSRQMDSMRQFYERQQRNAPSSQRTREIITGVRQQQATRNQMLARPYVSLGSLNDSYRQQERVQQARNRQVRFDAMEAAQHDDAHEQADRASHRAASDRFRFVQASERQAAERRVMFSAPREATLSDIAALAGGDGERLLRTNSVYRGHIDRQRAPLMPRLSRFGSGVASAANMVGAGGIAGAGYLWQRSNQDFIERSDRSAEDFDSMGRSLDIQAGMSGRDSIAARNRIHDFALRSAVNKDFAYSVGTQLVSSGFSPSEATGPALHEMLKGVNAMPAPGGRRVDPVALSEAAASYMTSQNMEKTGPNLRNVLAGVQTLYKSTNFQLEDFSQLAGQADTMRGRLTMGEQFGAFSVLRDVGDSPEEATTALRNIAIRTQTTQGSPAKTEALAVLGLKPKAVDMDGESFLTVLDRLAGAIEGKDSAQVTSSLEEVFGERTLSAVLRLIEDRGKVKERSEAVGDVTQYEADAATMSSGPAAAKRRQELQSELFAKEHSQKDDLLKQELSQQALERGESPFRVEARKKQYELYRGAGMDRDTAAAAAFGDYGLGVGGLDRVNEAKRTLAEKGMLIDPAIVDVLGEQAKQEWRDRGHGEWVASDPFDRTGKTKIGPVTPGAPRNDAEIRAENERRLKEDEEKRHAGLIAPRSKTGGQQIIEREEATADLLRQIRDAITNQQPVVAIRGGDRRPPVNLPLISLGAGFLTPGR